MKQQPLVSHVNVNFTLEEATGSQRGRGLEV